LSEIKKDISRKKSLITVYVEETKEDQGDYFLTDLIRQIHSVTVQ
jgi:hypothetical protein